MSHCQLRYFKLGGPWGPLFRSLPGWEQLQPAIWSDGVSLVILNSAKSAKIEAGLYVPALPRAKNAIDGFRFLFGSPSSGIERALLPSEPTRLKETTKYWLGLQRRVSSKRAFVMNHVAINLPDLDLAAGRVAAVLPNSLILKRTKAWEPVSQDFVSDAHFYRGRDFYITLREKGRVPEVDHVGWWCRRPQDVDSIVALLKKLKWPILWGPQEIDGSYLVHFQGPDGRIHDFFCPSKTLALL